MIRPQIFLSTLLMVTVPVLAGCPRQATNDDQDTLFIGVESPARSFDPREAIDAYSDRVNKLLYRGLFRLNRNGDVEPDLVSAFRFSGTAGEGTLTLDIDLHDGVTFHNGHRLTSADVVWTYQSVVHGGGPRSAGLESIREVSAVTPTRIRFFLTAPFAPLLSSLCMGIVPTASGKELAQQPVGSGSFRLAEENPSQLVLIRYPAALPDRYNKLVLRIIRNDTARSLALENGEIDLVQNALPPQDLSRFAESDKFVVDIFDGSNISYIGFNLRDPSLADPRIRRAISLAIDRKALLHSLLYDTGKQTGSVLPQSNWAYNAAITPDQYDPMTAAQLLRQVGYGPKHPLYLTYKTSTNRLRVRVAEAIAEYLQAIGIGVKVESLDFGTFFDQIRSGSFQMFSLTWTGLTDPDILYFAFASEATPPTGANRGFFSNPELDRLVTEARRELDLDKRRDLYLNAQTILAESRPYALLWQNQAIIVRRSSVPRIDPFPDGNFRFVDDMVLTAMPTLGSPPASAPGATH